MWYKLTLAVLLLFMVAVLTGCMTYKSYLKVDELTKRIDTLTAEAEAKITEAKTGDLTTAEALEFVRYANKEIARAKTELDDIRKTDSVGWPEIVGAVLVSMLGGGGIIRAWRGPSHKNITKITT